MSGITLNIPKNVNLFFPFVRDLKVEELPKIFSTSSEDAFCAVISKQVLLFNSSCTVLQATLNFGLYTALVVLDMIVMTSSAVKC